MPKTTLPLTSLQPSHLDDTATRHCWHGQEEVRIILPDHKITLLSAKAGLVHRSETRCADGLTSLVERRTDPP